MRACIYCFSISYDLFKKQIRSFFMNYRALVAEFIGTFALIFIGVGSIAAAAVMKHDMGLVGIALAHGLTIAVMASATGAVSGGHLNPAVTFGALVTRKIAPALGVAYIIVQVLGAFLGAICIGYAFPLAGPAKAMIGAGTPAIAAGVTTGAAFVMEFILTFFLVFVIFGTAFDRRAPKTGALFIGLTVTLDILAGGPITGAAMNPARHFGPALLAGMYGQMWLYWLAPLLGGAAAAIVYVTVLEERVGEAPTTVQP
jgi:aquaporin Z